MQAAAGLLATQHRRTGTALRPVEKIDLDDGDRLGRGPDEPHRRGRRRRHQDRRPGSSTSDGRSWRASAPSRRPRDPAEIVRTIGELVAQARRHRRPVEAVGVSAAGFVDKARADGAVRAQPRLARRAAQAASWRSGSTCRSWSRTTPTPRPGASSPSAPARTSRTCCCSPIGTGVGGGVVLDGELIAAASGSAAEVGHIAMVPGRRACAAAATSAAWSLRLAARALVREPREQAAAATRWRPRTLLERAGGDVEEITGPAGHRGRPARATRSRSSGSPSSATGSGEGMATLTAVLDPDVVVIGGGVERGRRPAARPGPRRASSATSTGRGHRPLLEIRQAQLGQRRRA